MKDDETFDKFIALFEKLQKLAMDASCVMGKVEAHKANLERVTKLMQEGKDPRTTKVVLGIVRDLSCELISLGSNLRRQCDIAEPIVDDAIKEKEP